MNVKSLAAPLIVAGCVVGCGDPRVPRAEASATTNGAPGNFSPAVGDAGRPSATQARNQFVDDLHRKLDVSDQKISELGRKMESLNEEAKAEAAKAIESWRVQRVQLGQKLDEIKQSGQEAGQEIKAGCESAVAELEKGFEKLKSRFKE
jgi:hypothetical protein